MKRILVAAVSIATAFVLLWQLLYSDRYDPKNLHYVAWKLGLLPMDTQRALSTMTHDDAFPVVRGRTREQLQKRFGRVFDKQNVSAYLSNVCAESRAGQVVLFLSSSDWMVVMQHGQVAELILCKG